MLVGAALILACIGNASAFSVHRPIIFRNIHFGSCQALSRVPEARFALRMSSSSIPSTDVRKTLQSIQTIASAEDKLPDQKELEVRT